MKRLRALASGNGDVRLVDVRTGDTTVAAGAHTGGAQAAAFEPRGQRMPFDDQVYGVRFSPDGQTLAVPPMDGSVRLLEAPAYH